MLEVKRMNGTVYMDLTGTFLVTSARGNKYLFIAYSFDVNGIILECMKSKHNSEMLSVFEKVYTKLTKRGIEPTFQFMDHEASSAVMDWLST